MRVIVRAVGEPCVTVGTLIVLFVVHLPFWTEVRADQVMDGQVVLLKDRWTRGSALSAVTPAPGATPGSRTGHRPCRPSETGAEAVRRGKPFAIMYVPRCGFTWNKPVLEGTETSTLKKGLGHYANTAQLGREGNFAVAGHRHTHGDPFKDFPRLGRGDAVVLTDGTTWFTYRIDRDPYKTVPTDIEVIDPVPRISGYTRPGRHLTLTPCEPEWGRSHRLIVWAHPASTQPVEAGKPEALRR